MMNFVCCAILFCIVSARYVNSYSILVVLPHPGKSHVDVFLPITKALAKKGHNVTVIGHYPVSPPMPNYRDVSLKNESVLFVEAINVGQIDPASRLAKYIMIPTFLEYMGKTSCEVGMETKEFQEFMQQRNRYHFDLMIMEMFNTDCFLGKSHLDVFLPITKALAKKGHKVTVIGHYPLSPKLPNYKDVSFKNESVWFVEAIDVGQIDPSGRLVKYIPTLLAYMAKTSCEVGMETKEFQNFMQQRNRYHFDLMIMEIFHTDCFLGLADIFNVPVVGLSSCTLMPWSSDRFANPIHTGYIPNNLLPFSDRMSFLERVENTVITTLHRFFYNYVMNANDRSVAKKYLGEEGSNLDNAIKRSSMMLVNTHFSLNLPRPFVPNVIEIGGVHIEEPKPLPEHIEKWISESTHGVIYMSLGSLLKGYTLPKDKREAIQQAFSRLPQRIIWKWENDTMEGQPKNVMLQRWAPQFDILSHPNVKAFVSHGGLLGTIESVHCGKPVVVIPQFGDQHTNAKALEASGGGVILNYKDITEKTFHEALMTVLDSKFQQQAKELSARYKDRPLSPLDTAIYWIEYVARHKGAPHMRTAAVDMTWYQYYLLDVIAFLIAVTILPVLLIYWMIQKSLRKTDKGAKIKQN